MLSCDFVLTKLMQKRQDEDDGEKRILAEVKCSGRRRKSLDCKKNEPTKEQGNCVNCKTQ